MQMRRQHDETDHGRHPRRRRSQIVAAAGVRERRDNERRDQQNRIVFPEHRGGGGGAGSGRPRKRARFERAQEAIGRDRPGREQTPGWSRTADRETGTAASAAAAAGPGAACRRRRSAAQSGRSAKNATATLTIASRWNDQSATGKTANQAAAINAASGGCLYPGARCWLQANTSTRSKCRSIEAYETIWKLGPDRDEQREEDPERPPALGRRRTSD